jgi:hypothetical protein
VSGSDKRESTQVAFVVGAVVVGLMGCGGGNAAETSTDGGPTPEDQAFIAELCTAVTPCCATNARTIDTNVCKQSLAKVGMSRDPQLRSSCLDEVRQRATTADCMPDMADFTDPCSRLFDEPSGSVAPGEACTSNAECAGSPGTLTVCSVSICVQYSVGAVGDYPCLATQVSDGLTILDFPMPAGATSLIGNAFVCQRRAGLYCNLTDNRCEQLLTGGSPCTDFESCDSRSCDDQTQTCVPLANVGEACGYCKGDNYCNAGVCAPRLATGAACTDFNQCTGACQGSDLCSGDCVGGACVPTNAASGLVMAVWCGSIPVSG